MKKDFIFTPILLVLIVLLALLKVTGLPAHIGISVAGVLILGAYTALTKKHWKMPVLEILMRVFYGIALISGIVVMNVHGVAALALIHRAGAALFVLALVILFAHKLIKSKKA